MIMDALDTFADNQSLINNAGTYLCNNSIDRGVTGTVPGGLVGPLVDDQGMSAELDLLVQIITTVTSGGAATIQFQLVMADDAALTTNLVVLQSTDVIALATMVAGYQFRLGVPVGITKRFWGVQYIIGTAAVTAGAFTASVVPRGGKQTNPSVG